LGHCRTAKGGAERAEAEPPALFVE